ncbi:GNAT family N-acetyltransferase [Actinotalea sp. BY-33]|uniref:GNAT family N-acetyltransferase n=1 Tax=Actinotalea soli TaxID=2819234 RepID=A0A939RWZ5_9CELL|nr:GNAT family N-acetyltransferase [Actinotalea soli]MBO1753143.1 GNAT family N-acetyltransferase [Actinotalea soli]
MSTQETAPAATPVAWDHPAVQELCTEQQAELRGRYDDDGGAEPNLPAEEMLVTLLVHVDGQPVATGSLRDASTYGTGSGEIKRMYVRAPYRGRGLSRLVLTALEAAATARGMRRLILETGVLQPEAIGLYRSAGYTPIPRYGPYVHEADSLCFERALLTVP